MKTFFDITNKVSKETTGLLEVTNTGFKLSYTKTEIENGNVDKDAEALKSLGFDFKIKGRKWKTIEVELKVVRKQGLKVWYA